MWKLITPNPEKKLKPRPARRKGDPKPRDPNAAKPGPKPKPKPEPAPEPEPEPFNFGERMALQLAARGEKLTIQVQQQEAEVTALKGQMVAALNQVCALDSGSFATTEAFQKEIRRLRDYYNLAKGMYEAALVELQLLKDRKEAFDAGE